jgi:hypothetical protein
MEKRFQAFWRLILAPILQEVVPIQVDGLSDWEGRLGFPHRLSANGHELYILQSPFVVGVSQPQLLRLNELHSLEVLLYELLKHLQKLFVVIDWHGHVAISRLLNISFHFFYPASDSFFIDNRAVLSQTLAQVEQCLLVSRWKYGEVFVPY